MRILDVIDNQIHSLKMLFVQLQNALTLMTAGRSSTRKTSAVNKSIRRLTAKLLSRDKRRTHIPSSGLGRPRNYFGEQEMFDTFNNSRTSKRDVTLQKQMQSIESEIARLERVRATIIQKTRAATRKSRVLSTRNKKNYNNAGTMIGASL